MTVNEAPWASGPNSATLTGAGVARNWAGAHGVNVRTYIAARLGDAPALAPNASSARGGLVVSMGFRGKRSRGLLLI